MNNLKTDDFDFELDESLIAQFRLRIDQVQNF